MKFRPYHPDDLGEFNPNEYSHIDVAEGAFEGDRYEKHTLDDNGHIAAIMLFTQTHDQDRVFGGFLMVSETFSERHAAVTRRFIEQKIAEYQPKELWTVSLADTKLTRWHEFLHLEKTGQIDVNDKLCDVWSRVWG